MSTRSGGIWCNVLLTPLFFLLSLNVFSQAFQNASLEVWGAANACSVNGVPDNWVGFSNEGINFDECDFAVCGSTIPAQAADGNVYGRAYSASTTTGEGIAQEVTGFIPGNEYQLSFEFAGSNLLPGFSDSQWHIFLDDVNVQQTIAFSSAEANWNTHIFSFFATNTTHVFGFRACITDPNGNGGSAAIDNFQIQDITPVVPVLPIAAFTQSEEIICVGECIVFTNESQFATEVAWSFESGDSATSQNDNEVVVCYNQPGVFAVELIATNADGSDVVLASQSVTVIANPEGILQLSGDTLVLTTDVGIGDFNWTLNGTTLLVNDYLITPVNSGIYQVNLQNQNICTTSLNLLVELPEVPEVPEDIAVWIPNAVTFGDDRINDAWGVFGELSRLESFKVQVYNRWGEVVFEAEDPSIRWTGNANGGTHYVQDGIYVFNVIMKFEGEIENRQYQGHITLIR